MKRVISILSVIALLFALLSGCGTVEVEDTVTEVRVLLPNSTGVRALVEGEAVISTQLYLLSRAYCEKLADFDMENFDAEAYVRLVEEASEAFRITEAFCSSLENHADALSKMEENETESEVEATYEVLSVSADETQSSSLTTIAYAAEETSSAVKYAEELTQAFDNAKNGQKLKAVAELYGTDVQHAKAMLEQAQAILEGDAYADQAEFENTCYKAATATKAAASAVGFGLAVAASGGIAAGGASVMGVMDAGGIVCGGLQAVIDTGNAISIYVSNGEENESTVFFEKADEALSPISTVFAIGSIVQNVKDIRNPEKAEQIYDYYAQAFLTGVGFVRDYAQDGKVLGMSANLIDDYREIICREADTDDPEAVKEVLTETGVSPEVLEAAEDNSGMAEQAEGFSAAADAYIEGFAELITPEDPMDVESVLQAVDTAFAEYALSEDIDYESITEIEDEQDTEPDLVTEDSTENTAEGLIDNNPLSAYNVEGMYHFDGLDASVEAVDETHLTVTDTSYNEVISGEYDVESGVFTADLGGDISWVVTITFTDTEDGIRGDYENVISGNVASASSALKEKSEEAGGLPASDLAGYYIFMSDSAEWPQDITVVDDTHLRVTDAEDEEAFFVGSYDENTGVLTYSEEDEASGYYASIVITFTDIGSGIQADMTMSINDMQIYYSGMKE